MAKHEPLNSSFYTTYRAASLDTLQAVSELPMGSIVVLRGSTFAKIYPTPDGKVWAAFFGQRSMDELNEQLDLPVKVIKRG
jgi:hypothetical protein